MSHQHISGQYFTTDEQLKQKLFEFISNNPTHILEPSIGRGDLVLFIRDKLPEVVFDMYEIDENIKLLDGVSKNDVLTHAITQSYDTIVGNPPYVRTTKGNLYIDFIEKCYNLLNGNGELIFIVPSDFF